MRTLTLFAIVAWLAPFLCRATEPVNPVDELNKINNWYQSKTTFQVNFNYLLYADISRKQLVEQHKGLFVRKGTSSYLKSLGTETILNSKFQVVVNHEEKIILASKNNQDSSVHITTTNPVDIIKLTEKRKNLKIDSIGKHHRVITVSLSGGDYKQVKLIYHKSTYQLVEMHLQFSTVEGINWQHTTTQPYLVVKYQNVKFNHKVKETYFDEQQFIRIVNGKAKPVLALKAYQLFSTI